MEKLAKYFISLFFLIVNSTNFVSLLENLAKPFISLNYFLVGIQLILLVCSKISQIFYINKFFSSVNCTNFASLLKN